MEPIQFNCPLCSGAFQIDPAMAGQDVTCPHCHGVVAIPAMDYAPAPTAPTGVSELGCPMCTGTFQVTAEMAGQEVSCPHCAGVVGIPTDIFGTVVSAPLVDPPVPQAPVPEIPAPQVPVSEPPVEVASQAPTVDPMQPPATSMSQPPVEPTSSPTTSVEGNMLPPSSGTTATSAARSMPNEKSSERTQKKKKSIDSLLPPGAATSPAPESPPDPIQSKADSLLPPGAAPANKGTTEKKKGKQVDSLLPPGAETSAPKKTGEQKALPGSEESKPASKSKSEEIVIPTEDGGSVTLHEPTKTVGEGENAVKLRSLSAEEKQRRRMMKNLIMFGICTLIMAIAAYILTAVK